MARNRRLQKYDTQVNSRMKVTTIAQLAQHYYSNNIRVRSISQLVRNAIEDLVDMLNKNSGVEKLEDTELAIKVLDSFNILPDSDDFDEKIARTRVIESTTHLLGTKPLNREERNRKPILAVSDISTVVDKEAHTLALEHLTKLQNKPIPIVLPPENAELIQIEGGNKIGGASTIQQIDRNPRLELWKKLPPNSIEGKYYAQKMIELKDKN